MAADPQSRPAESARPRHQEVSVKRPVQFPLSTASAALARMAGVKRVQAIAAAVFLATVGATGLVAVPPAAASVTVAAQASHPAIPAIQCHIVPHRFVTYASRCRSPHGYLCIPNN